MRSALQRATVIVPARNEAQAIAAVVADCQRAGARRVVVVDNGSRDSTAGAAAAAGADVIAALRPGYGWACLAGTHAAAGSELVAFIDGDGSFAASDLARLAALVASGACDLAIGARRAPMPAHQRAGNALTLALLRALYGVTLRDIGPLRIVRGELLAGLAMEGSRYAWLVEMLAKAARRRARIASLQVAYGPRLGGASKVSGTLRGSLLTGLDYARALLVYRRW